jgi:hypothetical protein
MAGKGKRRIEAIGYMRTSSATNVGRDKDSEVRQRAAIESYAKAAGSSGERGGGRCPSATKTVGC